MRDWIDITAQLLQEGGETIPRTDYGYWIDPQGNFIPVSQYETHQRVFRQSVENPAASYNTAFRAGWLRIVFDQPELTGGHRLICDSPTGFIGARTLMGLIRLARSGPVRRFEAEIAGEYRATRDLDEFLAFVRQNRRRPDAAVEKAAAARRAALGAQFGVELP